MGCIGGRFFREIQLQELATIEGLAKVFDVQEHDCLSHCRELAGRSAALEDALQKTVFEECGATQERSVGWVPPRGEPMARWRKAWPANG
jgi:hypothetical protein